MIFLREIHSIQIKHLVVFLDKKSKIDIEGKMIESKEEAVVFQRSSLLMKNKKNTFIQVLKVLDPESVEQGQGVDNLKVLAKLRDDSSHFRKTWLNMKRQLKIDASAI